MGLVEHSPYPYGYSESIRRIARLPHDGARVFRRRLRIGRESGISPPMDEKGMGRDGAWARHDGGWGSPRWHHNERWR